MKNLTDFCKAVETGLDPRLIFVFVKYVQKKYIRYKQYYGMHTLCKASNLS